MRKHISLILAAGQGTRMKSDSPKVLHKICGKPMLGYMLDITRALKSSHTIVVTSHQAEKVEEYLGNRAIVVRQAKPLGTAHAVKSARTYLRNFHGDILVLYADTPLLTAKTLRKLIRTHYKSLASCALLTATLDNPFGYGRIIKDKEGNVIKIIEEKDATYSQKSIKEVNIGAYCFRSRHLCQVLDKIKANNKKKEYYLTDAVAILSRMGRKVISTQTSDHEEFLGINSRKDLARAQDIVRARIMNRLMSEGVTIVDPATTYIEHNVKIGRDTVIHPMTVIKQGAVIGKRCAVGPFARLKPGTVLSNDSRVGSFGESGRTGKR